MEGQRVGDGIGICLPSGVGGSFDNVDRNGDEAVGEGRLSASCRRKKRYRNRNEMRKAMKIVMNKKELKLVFLVIYALIATYFSNPYARIAILICFVVLSMNDYLSGFKDFRLKDRKLLWFLFPLSILIAQGENQRAFVEFFLLTLVAMNTKAAAVKGDSLIFGLIRGMGIVTAASVYLEKLSPGILFSTVYQLYPLPYQETLMRQVQSNNYYSGIFPEVSITAGVICLAVFVLLVRKRKRYFEISFLVISLIFVGKRAHFFVACLVIFFDYWFFSGKKRKLAHVLKLAALGVVAALLLWALIRLIGESSQLNRMVNLVLSLFAEQSESSANQVTSGRYSSFLQAWEWFRQSPLRGKGWYYFQRNYYNEYLGTYLVNVHNIYLQLLCEGGILGLAGFIVPALATFATAVKQALACQEDSLLRVPMEFAMCYQLFFLIYGVSGVQFDQPFYYTFYFISVMLTFGGVGWNEK